MRLTLPATLALSLAITSATAQLSGSLFSGLSTGCLGGLASLLSETGLNECLHLSQAITTFGSLESGDSVIPSLSTFLSTQICPNAACNTTTISAANSTIAQDCATDLSSGNSTIPEILIYLFDNYDAFRTAACLEDTSMNNTLCLVETLT
jgi:hypothetical protein